MRGQQKTILEKTKPAFPGITQPLVSAGFRSDRTGLTFTPKFRRVADMPKVTDGENRRLSHAHKVRLSDDEEAAFQEFCAAFDLTAQDVIRGLINSKLWIDNDGLAAMLRCMSAKGRVSNGR